MCVFFRLFNQRLDRLSQVEQLKLFRLVVERNNIMRELISLLSSLVLNPLKHIEAHATLLWAGDDDPSTAGRYGPEQQTIDSRADA